MAFAPPRKAKTVETSRPVRTRLPVPSPAKKSTRTDDVVVSPAATLPVEAEKSKSKSRIIPSRYLQDATRGPLKSSSHARPAQTRPLHGQNALLGSPRKDGHLRHDSQSHIGQSVVLASPTKRATSQVAEDDAVTRDMLALRISHTMRSCDEGEVAFTALRKSAEVQLEGRWIRAKEAHVKQQLATRHERLQQDALELQSLRTEDVYVMDEFISRVGAIRAKTVSLAQLIEIWAQSTEAVLPDKQWKETIASLETQCDSARLLAAPLIQRLDGVMVDGIVKQTLLDFSAILNMTREELVLLETYMRRMWLKKKQDVDEAFAMLSLPETMVEERAFWSNA